MARKGAARLASTVGLALALALAAPASAQQLNLGVLTPALSGAAAGHYFVADATVDLALSIVVSVATAAERRDFEAELAVVGLDGATCSDLAALPAECVHTIQRIAFAANEIAIQGGLAIPKQVGVALSPAGADAFDGFVASQVLAGRAIQFRLFFDRTDVYPVDPGYVPVFGAPVTLLPLSGVLRFADDIETQLLSFVRGGNCAAAGGWTVNSASAAWQPGSDPSWQTANVFLSPPDCVEPIAGDQALDLQLSAGSALVSSANGTIGGLPVTLVNTSFTPAAVAPGSVRIDLPPDTSVHVRSPATGLPLPRGSGDLTFFGALTPDSGDFDDLDVSLAASLFLRAEGLPFSFEVDEIAVGAGGLTAHVVETHYHYDLPFAAQDPRGTRGARSNDARFRRAAPADLTVTIDGDGLHGTASFLAGTADTHYPRTETSFGATTVEVAASALVGGQVLPLAGDRYRFDQLPYCAGCPDADAVPRFDLPVALGQGLAADGAVLARTGAIGENAEWGPEDIATGSRVFARRTDQSLPGAVYLPGFRALGTAETDDVPGYLLGAREGVTAGGAFQPLAHFPLDHFQTRIGNHFHPGLTMGPERLVGAAGTPEVGEGVSLAGRATRIGFGGPVDPDFENVIGNGATKYVVREAGVTFLLNTDTPPQPIVYGHQLDVRRFAVRGIANALDDESWFDATVSVPAPGDFDVSFSSLALECTGDVGGGRMDIEACDESDDNGNGVVDENCDERLLAWRTPISIRNAEFKRVIEGGTCDPGGRDFYVLGRIEPLAFDESMMLGAFWDADGTPYDAHFEGSTNRQLDRPDVFSGSDEYRGFDVAIDSDVELALTPERDEGWFRLDGLLGLPFWEDAPIDLRIQNRSEEEPAQTLVFRQGTLENIPSQELVGNDAPSLIAQMRNVESTHARARYEWGATELELDLPIFYDDGRHDENRMPRFLGIPERKNLSIFDADAGVNFATPETTRVSFGATANFDPLADEASELATFLDLNQPGCSGAAPLDSFLNEWFFVPLDGEGHGPIHQLCQGVSEAQDLLGCWSGGGLELCMEQALSGDLHAQLGDPDGVAEDINQARLDALLGVMNPVVQIGTLISGTTDPANYVAQDQQMVALYNNVPFPAPIPPVGGVPDVIQLQRTNPALFTPAMLGGIQGALNLAAGPLAGISTSLGQAQLQLAQAQADVDAVFAQLIADVDVAVAQIAAAQAELESGPLQLCSEANAVFVPAAEAREQIGSLLDKLGDTTETLRLVFELFEFDGKKVEQALAAFVSYGNDVDTAAGSAIAGIDKLLACDDDDFDELELQGLFNGVIAEIEALRAAVEAMGPATKAFRDRLLVDTNAVGVPDGGWIGPGGSVETELDDAIAVVSVLLNLVNQLVADTNTLIAGYPMAWPINPYVGATANLTRTLWDQHVSTASAGRYVWFYPGAGGAPDTSVVNALTTDATNSLLAIQSDILQTAQTSLVPVLDLVPRFEGGDGLVAWIVGRVMGLPETEVFVTRAHELLDEPVGAAIDLIVHMLDNVESLMRNTLAALGTFEDRFFKVTDSGRLRLSRLGHFDNLTGYAVIHGDDLERLHMVANFDFLHEMFDGLIEMPIAIDITRWSSYNEVSASCMRNVPVRTLKDTTIRAEGYFGGDGANILGSPVGLDSLLIKYIDQAGNPIANVGGFGVLGDLQIGIPGIPPLFVLHDLRATWGDTKVLRFCEADPETVCWHDNECSGGDTCSPAPLEDWGHCNAADDVGCGSDDDCEGNDYCVLSPLENEDFTGARVKASLFRSGVPLDVAVFQGRTCSRDPIEALDPQAAEFISFIDDRFRGIYVRGGVTFPIIPGACVYNVKVGADVGVWGTWSGEKISSTFDSVGALLSGNASGKIACLAGLRGQVTLGLEGVPGVGPTLGGEAFGVAGLGFDCDPDTWDSVQRSRSDRWCATTDGRAFVVLRKGKYERGSLSISGIH